MKNIVRKMMGLAALAVLTLGGVTEVKAQTTTVPSTWTSVRFNNDVRYSQWIINSRIADFYANSTHVGFGVFDGSGKQTTAPITTSKLDYVPGLVAKAIVENVKLNKDYSWAAPWYYSMKKFGDTYYNLVASDGKNGKSQDDLNGIKMFFALKDLTVSGAKYENSTTYEHCNSALADARTGLYNQNNSYFIGHATNSGMLAATAQSLGMYGGWFHKSKYKDEMWCDGLYMGPALLAQLINEYGDYEKINGNAGEDDWDLITRLFTISWSQLYNSSNGLLYHAFAAASHTDYSATWAGYDPANGVYHSAAHWGRACGWYFLALVDILEQMDAAGKSGTTNYTTLKGYLNSLAAGLANYQDATTGCWYQVLDEKDSHLDGNYLESSCTAIFAAAYLKGTRLHYFTSDYSTVAEKAYKGCVNQFMMFDDSDKAQLIHCCASAGLGKNNNKTRDGSRSYYITGSDVTQRNTYTEGKVLGGFILAATEYERAYQASKAILFSTDLKASYDLQSGDGITIEACGADGAQITYQWYKDGVAVDGETSATIAPKASGDYYCKATSGSTTITSSTAQVTVAGDDTFTPEFTTNLPATATATVGTAKTLTVAADHADGYQWYSNTTASNTGGQTISGATSASYTFTPNATGTLYYYCVATNSKATGTQSVASNVCTVTVSEAPAGPTVLYSTDFSSSDWSGKTNICNSSNAANETYNGITFHSYNSTAKPFVVNQSAGTMTWCNNNMGNNYWIAIPVTGVNGSLTITVSNGNSKTNFKYVVKQETSISGNPGSGSNATEGTPATVTVNDLDKSDYVVYLGRQGSGLTTIKSITITTPAGGDTPTPTTYTVSYNMNGHGTAIDAVEGVTALPDPLPSPEATGYTFGGWYTDSGLNNAATAGASISADTELYAKWTLNAPTFSPTTGNTINPTDNVTISGIASNYVYTAWGASAIDAATLTVEGNKKTYNGSGNFTATASGTGTRVLSARAYDGTLYSDVATATYTIRTANTLALSTASGSVEMGNTLDISGYVTDKNNTSTTVTYTSNNTGVATVSAAGVITPVAVGSTTITVAQEQSATYTAGEATFTVTVTSASPTTYTVSYNMNGHGEEIADVTNVTALPNPLPSPEATGYIFGGWYTDSGLNNAATAGASISADTELYAKWTEEPAPATNYTVKFYNGETQFGAAQTIEEGATVSAPTTNPAKDGYTFKGWALENGSTARVLFPYPVYSNVNFYAVWSNTTSGGGGEDETVFSVTPTTNISISGKATDTEITSNYATLTGGRLYATNVNNSSKNMIQSQGSQKCMGLMDDGSYFKVVLSDSKVLQAGDKINGFAYFSGSNSTRGIWLSSSNSRPSSEPTTKVTVTSTSSGWQKMTSYTVTTNDGLCGQNIFYIYRANSNNTYFNNFTITREGQGDDTNITLETVSDYDNFESYAGDGKTVTFKRSFNNGKWTTLVLPFSATTAQVIAAFEYPNDCEFANIKSMTVTAQGTGSISYVTTSQITANTPILAKIKPNDGLSGKEGFTANEYVFTDVTVENPESAEAVTATSTDGNVTMYGVYKNTARSGFSSLADEEAYFLYNGKFYDFSWLSNMTPFTAYIVPQTTSGNTLKGLTFEEDNATGINETLRYENETLRYENSFNLAGQKVGKGYKGMVISKGRKIIDN